MKDKLRDILSSVLVSGGYIIFMTGWLYNIVLIVDNWATYTVLSKIIHVFSIFALPIGSFFGIAEFVLSFF